MTAKKPAVLVFCDGKLYKSFDITLFFNIWIKTHIAIPKLYNNAYVWDPDRFGSEWGRMDGIPCLLKDVPKEYRTLLLLMS